MKYAALAVVFLISASAVWAHGNFSVERDVGDYRVDLHYPKGLHVDEPISLNFFLKQRGTEFDMSFTDLDITVVKDEEVIFKTNLARKVNVATGAIVTFHELGDYTVHTRFYEGGTELVSATLPLKVEAEPGVAAIWGFIVGTEFAVGVVLGVLATLLLTFARRPRVVTTA